MNVAEPESDRIVTLFSVSDPSAYVKSKWIESNISPTYYGRPYQVGDPLTYNEDTAQLLTPTLSRVDVQFTRGKVIQGRWSSKTRQASPTFRRALIGNVPAESAADLFLGYGGACLGLTFQDQNLLSKIKPDQWVALANSTDGDDIVNNWPSRTHADSGFLLQALQTALKRHHLPSELPGLEFGKQVVEAEELTSNGTEESSAPHPATQSFQKLCSSCHNESKSRPLPLNDLSALKTYRAKKSGRSIQDYLKKGEMPPPPEADEVDDYPQFTKEDIHNLIESLK